MVDDDTGGDSPPQRRVVRRVVRRTVVAPPPPTVSRVRSTAPDTAPPSSAGREPDPDRPTRPGGRRRERVPLRQRLADLRPTRPETAPEDPPEPEPAPETTPEPAAETTPEPAPSSEPTPARVPLRARLSASTAAARDRSAALLERAVDRSVTLPRPAYAAVVGFALGLATVLVCWLAILVFAATLGTPAGGRWGFGVLVLVGVAAAVAGTRLLAAADVPEPGGTSVIAVLLVPVVVLALFLGLSTTGWAAVIVPLLGAASFAAVQPVTERLSARPRDTAA